MLLSTAGLRGSTPGRREKPGCNLTRCWGLWGVSGQGAGHGGWGQHSSGSRQRYFLSLRSKQCVTRKRPFHIIRNIFQFQNGSRAGHYYPFVRLARPFPNSGRRRPRDILCLWGACARSTYVPCVCLAQASGRGGEVGTADTHALQESQRPPRPGKRASLCSRRPVKSPEGLGLPKPGVLSAWRGPVRSGTRALHQLASYWGPDRAVSRFRRVQTLIGGDVPIP